jgi:hypothetical protein
MQEVIQGNWKPKWYLIPVTCDVTAGSEGENSVTLDARPFICKKITHALVGRVKDDQHGDYNLMIRDDKTSYQNLPANANAMFGSVFDGGPEMFLPKPIHFNGSSVVTARVQNPRTRTEYGGSGVFNLHVLLHGIEKVD